MTQSPPPTHAFPGLKRPSEAVVYRTLFDLCAAGEGRCAVSLRELAAETRLSVNTVNRAVTVLTGQGLLSVRPGCNQFHPTIYELSTDAGANLPSQANAVSKNGVPIPSDSDGIGFNINLSDKIDGNGTRKIDTPNGEKAEKDERLARLIARELDDMGNLALYRNYCSRFPAIAILKAYIKVRETAPENIKKSRGALFNFLVQKYGKTSKPTRDSGRQAGQRGNRSGGAVRR